jgi:transposase InsO family protein
LTHREASPAANTPRSDSPNTFNWKASPLDRDGRQGLRQRTDGVDHRLYKSKCIATTVFHDGPYKTLADIEYATAGWVDWYNHRRLHGSLGMLTPTE